MTPTYAVEQNVGMSTRRAQLERTQLDRAPLDRLVASFAAEQHCPSISWGITIDGELLTGSIGHVTEHTVFRIASMTKSFSAAATLILRDEGVLRLDEPVATHAKELVALDRFDAAPITIRDLLTMASGLPTDDPWADRHLDLTDDEFDRIIAEGPLFAHSTGNVYEYSNFGFAVLGRVVHRASGVRLQDVVTSRLLGPLGMERTGWIRPDHDDWARPMRWLDDGHVAEREPLPDGLIAPMGGIWTTVTDLNRWVTWLDDAFPARGEPDDGPLCRASRREMQSPQRYTGMGTLRGVRSAGNYGLGLQVLDEPDLGTVVAHSGGLPGYGSNMRWLPGRRIGAIALANVTYAPMTELTARLLDEVQAQGLVPLETVPVSDEVAELAARLVALVNEWDDDRARQVVTQSLIQDDSLERLRAAAERITAVTGPLAMTSIEPQSAARATIRCTGATGRTAGVSLLLAPPRPPLVQLYTVTLDPAGDPTRPADR
jgi:CubicO group peptidase (beta-lactamase class C family)